MVESVTTNMDINNNNDNNNKESYNPTWGDLNVGLFCAYVSSCVVVAAIHT